MVAPDQPTLLPDRQEPTRVPARAGFDCTEHRVVERPKRATRPQTDGRSSQCRRLEHPPAEGTSARGTPSTALDHSNECERPSLAARTRTARATKFDRDASTE